VPDGPPWTDDQARVAVRRFLDILADGRATEDDDDPLAYANKNGLLILIGPGERDHFDALLARMPDAMADEWRAALQGGRVSDAFGPMTEDETQAEARIEQELKKGRRRVSGGVVVAVLVIVGLIVAYVAWDRRDTSVDGIGTIRFADVADSGPIVDRSGPPPKVEPTLLVRLDTPVALRPGTGDAATRIATDVPPTDLPQVPGSVAATVFRYGGRGQVVLVGPDGWTANACVEVSVLTAGLRPLDTASYQAGGACPRAPTGRTATVGCLGTNALMLDLVLSQGSVALEEGGTAQVASIRVKVVGKNPAYESISINGRIQLDAGQQVTVPVFGGEANTEARFDVSRADGAPIVGRCTLK
jgi:hypothetical protein